VTWPVPGARVPSSSKLQWGNQRSPTHTHNGLDIPAPEGTPVVAARAGRVEQASAQWQQGFSGYGGHVVIASGPERDLYAHLAAVAVAPGQVVQAGERIGSVGRTAFTAADRTALLKSGPHLHFERSPRAYPQASELPRLDPLPILGGPMRSLADLSALFVGLRAAVVDRAGKVRPGVAPAHAAIALKLADEFRVWADQTAPGLPPWEKPSVFRDREYARWETAYMQMRKDLGAAGAPLAEVDPSDPLGFGGALGSTLERAVGGLAVGAGLVLGLMLWRRNK
jgi:Peptidase family M23